MPSTSHATSPRVSPSSNQIIPRPALVTPQPSKGSFTLSADACIVASDELRSEASFLQAKLKPATGFELPVLKQGKGRPVIHLQLERSLSSLAGEGYRLRVEPDSVVITAATPAGVFYGIESLLQLLPGQIFSPEKQPMGWDIACVAITDQPRFAWRAFMLDEARYFHGMDAVKCLLDEMAALKMNVFHWHLTDDQGWRIEIKKYPRLTEVGSKRADSQTGGLESEERAGSPHEGYYTQDEIREIVAYAGERHITIVPEIGMPGHASAAIAAYPELGMPQCAPMEVPVTFGKKPATYNPADEEVYAILKDILTEVAHLFPGDVIHIGGDEVLFDQWRESAEISDLMQREQLKTIADVQIHFVNRIAAIVAALGKRVMGWNEILGDDPHGVHGEGANCPATSLSKDAIVHFWIGDPELAKRAIAKGYQVVNSWHKHTYLDYDYAQTPLQKAYDFDPVFAGLDTTGDKQIIGSGCQMWGEWIPTRGAMEHQVFPRIAAYAEGGWTPRANKDFASFKSRLASLLRRWETLGIVYAGEAVTGSS